MQIDAAIIILAGGEATRLPSKLEREIEGEPMLLRVFHKVRGRWPIFVAGSGNLSPTLDAGLECPLLIDRWSRRGPLAALVSAASAIAQPRIFAVAGDAPNVTLDVLELLANAWQPECDAVVAYRDSTSEPLVAIYDRIALVREGFDLLAAGASAMHSLLDRLATVRIAFDASVLLNVNTAADYMLAASSCTKGS